METPLHIPLSELLHELREEGFIIGVDTYLALDELLNKLDAKSLANPEKMRHMICPLFATDREQQDDFYRIYDKLIAEHIPVATEETASQDPAGIKYIPAADVQNKRSKARRDLLIFIGLIFTFAALIVAAWLIPWEQHVDLEHESTTAAKAMPAMRQLYMQYPWLKAGAVPKISKTEADSVQYMKMYAPPIAGYEASWEQRFHSPLMYAGLALLIILSGLFLLYEYYNWYRRRMIARLRTHKSPPLSWPIEVDEKLPVLYPDSFFMLARAMRKRIARGAPVLDVINTVKASARQGGRLEFCYKDQSQPAEYLVLIDTGHQRDLLTSWFDFLFEKLQKNQVNISAWYYNNDPRHCWNETHRDGVNLNYLQYHYGGHKLLIIGDGSALLDAGTGTLEPWTEVLRTWRNMALLSTRPIHEWSLNELFLSENLPVLPATTEGLLEITEHFENHNPDFIPYKLREKDAAPAIPAQIKKEDTLSLLTAYFSHDANEEHAQAMLRWLTACCLLPELYWNLTLYLGKHLPALLPAPQNGEEVHLLSLSNLYALAALPWFREGKVPDDVRKYLLEESGLLSPAVKKEVSAMLMKLLQQNQPEDKTQLAYDYRNMQIVVMELLQKPENKRRQELLSQLKYLREITQSREYLTLDFLQNKRSRFIDTILPPAIKNIFFNDGMVFNGPRTIWKTVLAFVVAAFLFSQIDLNRLEGEVVDYNSKSYFVDNPYKKAALITFRTDTLYNDRIAVDVPTAENGLDYQNLLYAAFIDSNCAPALADIYIYNYNAGVLYFKMKRYNEALTEWSKNITVEKMVARSLRNPNIEERDKVITWYEKARAAQRKALALLGR